MYPLTLWPETKRSQDQPRQTHNPPTQSSTQIRFRVVCHLVYVKLRERMFQYQSQWWPDQRRYSFWPGSVFKCIWKTQVFLFFFHQEIHATLLTLSSVDQNRYPCKQWDPDETAHNKPSHQDLHCLRLCFVFWLTSLFATETMSKFNDGKVQFINSGWKRLMVITFNQSEVADLRFFCRYHSRSVWIFKVELK